MDVRDLSLQTRHPSQATWPSVVTGNGICTQVPIKSPLLHPLPFFPRYCPPRRSEPWEGSTDISRLAPRNYSRGTQSLYVLNPAHVPL